MENAKIFITTSSATVPFHHTMENTVKTVRISLSIFNSLRSSFEFSAVYVKRTFHQRSNNVVLMSRADWVCNLYAYNTYKYTYDTIKTYS